MIYLYDGSFEGLMTVIYISTYDRLEPSDILSQSNYQAHLFEEIKQIKTDKSKNDKVINAIYKNLSECCYDHIRRVYLSEEIGSEMLIWHFLKIGWKIGTQVENHLTDFKILQFIKLSKKVSNEVHRYLGLIRFQKLENDIYYSAISPDHKVLPMLSFHFSNRFKDQNWIIHDVKREIALLYNKKKTTLIKLSPNDIFSVSSNEFDYQNLWCRYYKCISIKERKNLKLQKRFMPKRYWKYLTEKQL